MCKKTSFNRTIKLSAVGLGGWIIACLNIWYRCGAERTLGDEWSECVLCGRSWLRSADTNCEPTSTNWGPPSGNTPTWLYCSDQGRPLQPVWHYLWHSLSLITASHCCCCVDHHDCVQQIQTESLYRQTEDHLQVIHQRDCIAVIKGGHYSSCGISCGIVCPWLLQVTAAAMLIMILILIIIPG